MKSLKFLGVLAAVAALAVGAGAVIAALGDSETASGSITVSSESGDLYICEPGAVQGARIAGLTTVMAPKSSSKETSSSFPAKVATTTSV